jgi:dCTP deaminase
VAIPRNAIAFISIKSSIKFRGLVNVSGFHVDPGFEGHLKYSVFNAGSEDVVLQRGEAAFPIWFCNLDRETEKYNGAHANQVGITSADASSLQGEIASPGSLKRRLDRVDRRLRFMQSQIAVLLAIGVGLFVARCGA